MKLDERGIKEFKFRDLPEDLKFQRGIQKARDLGLLESVEIIEGCHTWRIVTSKISKKATGMQNKKE